MAYLPVDVEVLVLVTSVQVSLLVAPDDISIVVDPLEELLESGEDRDYGPSV